MEAGERAFVLKQVILSLLDALYGLRLDEVGLLLIVVQLLAVVLVDPFPLGYRKLTRRRSSWKRVLTSLAYRSSICFFSKFF